MADYYPLLARALDALPDRSPALRKAVYDRARTALVTQLRSLDPPLADADIDLERQALDTAIGRLEAVYEVAPEPEPVPPPETMPEPAPPAPAATSSPERPALDTLPPATPPDFAPTPDAQALPEPGPPEESFVPFAAPPPDPIPVVPAKAGGSEDGAVAEAGAEAPEIDDPGAGKAESAQRQRPRLDVVAPGGGRSRRLRHLLVGSLLALVIGLIAMAAFLLRDPPASGPALEAGGAGQPQETGDAKYADRVGGEASPEPERRPAQPRANAPELAVAQKATLLEENTGDPQAAPTATQGRVLWRQEAVNGEEGQPVQTVVRAQVEFPEAGLSLSMTLRRNADATLPASHIIELAFTNYGPGEKRAVQDIGLIQLKDEETGRGSPVSGLPVRVRENLFLIGLSSLTNDVERNTTLLKEKQWFDLVVKYVAGPRAVLTFEKGGAGTQALQDAFAQWEP